MRKPKLREIKEAVTSLVKGPYTSAFPFAPAKTYEAFRGQPQFHEEDCIGCGACAEVCPARTIDVIDEGNTRTLIHHFDNCIYCGQCEANCTTKKGIILSDKFDLAVFDREQAVTSVEKELVRCEHCGDVITTVDQLKWIARKVGSLSVANPAAQGDRCHRGPVTARRQARWTGRFVPRDVPGVSARGLPHGGLAGVARRGPPCESR
jgi:hydrogenase-4 component H